MAAVAVLSALAHYGLLAESAAAPFPRRALLQVRTAACHRQPPTAMTAPADCSDGPLVSCANSIVNLTPCGGVRKMLMRAAPADAGAPPSWGAVVDIRFTGMFMNGSVFYDAHAQEPFSFQLNTGTVVDGMDRGVRTMRPGERALLRVESRFGYGGAGVGHRIPPNATLVYDVELLEWKDGPPFENQDFDMETYKRSLEGKDVSSGQNEQYTWSEGGEEVTMWLPMRDGESTGLESQFR